MRARRGRLRRLDAACLAVALGRGRRPALQQHAGAVARASRRLGKTTSSRPRRVRPRSSRRPRRPSPRAARRRVDRPWSSTRLRGGVWTANGDVGTISYADIEQAGGRPRGPHRQQHHARWPSAPTSRGSPPSTAPARRCRSSTRPPGRLRRRIPSAPTRAPRCGTHGTRGGSTSSLEDDGAVAVSSTGPSASP